jgi:hypothetical protein
VPILSTKKSREGFLPFNHPKHSRHQNKNDVVTCKQAFELMGRDKAFRAMVHSMNTLLIKKSVYTTEEFEQRLSEHLIHFKRSFSARTASADASSATSISNRWVPLWGG